MLKLSNVTADAFGVGHVELTWTRDEYQPAAVVAPSDDEREDARVMARAALVKFWQDRQGARVANVYAALTGSTEMADGVVLLWYRESDDPGWTLGRFAAEVRAELRPTYQLTYVDRNDQLSPAQVAALVRNDGETLGDSLDEWTADQQHDSATGELEEVAKAVADAWEREHADVLDEHRDSVDPDAVANVVAAWEVSDDREDVRSIIMERDNSDPLRDLARNTPPVLLRIPVGDFDGEGWSKGDDEQPDPYALLAEAGVPLPADAATVDSAADILANADTEGTVFLLATVDVCDLWDIQDGDDVVTFDRPSLLLSNVYQGNGFEGEVRGPVSVKASQLRTDEDAPGYSWQTIAGPVLSAYATDVTITRTAADL